MYKFASIILLSIVLTACGGGQATKPAKQPSPPSAQQDGGYYLDDGPGAEIPKNLDQIPDATPRDEPIKKATTRPYRALGKVYVPMKSRQAFKESGIASWYGKRFHGRKTAIGETYNMYAMTAAHKTLPLPSYIRVTNPANQKSVVVRVNDRGPFKAGRIVDLSYAAAHRLGIVQQGSAPVTIEVLQANSQTTPPKTLPQPVATKPANAHGFYVQAGAFRSLDNLNALKQQIRQSGIADEASMYHVYNNGLYKLRLGVYASRPTAVAKATSLRQRLQIQAIVKTQ